MKSHLEIVMLIDLQTPRMQSAGTHASPLLVCFTRFFFIIFY